MPIDPRYVPGNLVEARAVSVTNVKECQRRYGADSHTATVHGVIVDVIEQRHPTTGRTTKKVSVDFDFGDNVHKKKTLGIRLLKHITAVPPPRRNDATNVAAMEIDATPLVTEINNFNINNNNDDNNQSIDLMTLSGRSETMDEANEQGEANNQPVQPTTLPFLASSPSGRPQRNSTVVASVNDTNWYHEPNVLLVDINGPVRYREWGVRTPLGDVLYPGNNSDERYSRMDIFLMMFPPRQLNHMLQATNDQLEIRQKRKTTKQELLKFFGIIILSTKYEFTSRATLWSTEATSKYELPAGFGRTGMGRVRFDELWTCVRFSYQPPVRPEEVTSEAYRWALVDGFVARFNNHRASTFIPSEYICVDESISRWYGQGGDWINHGLPMYVAIDRKPENGCEIQNAACGRSGVMLQLKLVKTANSNNDETAEAAQARRDQESLLHGTRVLKELVQPWAMSDRCICADSYFASVKAVEELHRMRLKFIGVIKTSTRHYPMQYLSHLTFHNRGDRHGVVSRDPDGNPNMMAFVWVDRERRYFIASAGSLAEGEPYHRNRWRQIAEEPNAEPERVELTVPQPRAAEMYYRTCARIDQHNRDRQSTLGIERKLVTNDWSLRVNLSIFAMIVVDTWRVYSGLTFNYEIGTNQGETQKEFYGRLAAELIDNRFDFVGRASGRGASSSNNNNDDDDVFDSPAIDRNTGVARSGVDAHITPTKRRQKDKRGKEKPFALQGRCKICSEKTTYECSVCRDDHVVNAWICHTKKGKLCFPQHISKHHT